MATLRQLNAVKQLVETGGNVSLAMKRADYSPNTYHTPSKLTDSKGYNELMEKYGLTEELIIGSLVDDIKGKPKKRYLELNLGAEMLQLKKQSPNGNTYNTIIYNAEQERRIANRIFNQSEGEELLDGLPDSNEPEV